MSRVRISQIAGFAALILIVAGATLYAANSPQRTTTNVLMLAGAALLAVYAIINARLIATFFARRSSRYGANMAVMIILYVCIMVIVQAMAARHNVRRDFTRNQRFSLAGQTLAILENLERDVSATAFYQQGTPDRMRAEDLLAQYAYSSSRFRYDFVDPDRRPQTAREFGISSYGTTVVRAQGRTERVTLLDEESLTNAIVRVTSNVTKTIYFVVGHGESDVNSAEPGGYSILRDAIEKQNYDVKTVSLFDQQAVPSDCYVLVVAGPTEDYFDDEIRKIAEYLGGGNNALFLIDPRVDLPNIERLLRSHRILLDNTVIIDPFSRVFGGDYTVPVVTDYAPHEITRGFDLATFYPHARSLRVSDEPLDGVEAVVLARSGKSAWAESDLDGVKRGTAARNEGDRPGPVAVAVAAVVKYDQGIASSAGSDESNVVVFGDADFAANSVFRLSGNSDLFLNVINFLAEEKDRIAIRPKAGTRDQIFLRASQGRMIFLLSVVLLPLSVITLGTTVIYQRWQRG